jgi:hypothetical protein
LGLCSIKNILKTGQPTCRGPKISKLKNSEVHKCKVVKAKAQGKKEELQTNL